MSETERRKQTISARKTDVERWSNPAQLEPAWAARSQVAANWIGAGTRVLDIGCGAMTLEANLPLGCHYQPCDVVSRDDRTIVVDLNEQPLPAPVLASSDLVVMLGVWEYLYRPEAVFRQISDANKELLCSYCDRESTHHLDRGSLGWVNNFALSDFVQLAQKNGMRPSDIQRIDQLQYVIKFSPVRLKPLNPAKRVHVLAYHNSGNFGDRLGFHLVNSILPPNTILSWGTLNPLQPPEDEVDLLVLGIGNSLFGGLLNDKLIECVARARHSIGIFGTQYREQLPEEKLAKLLDHLGHWYARYEDDVRLYGRGRSNVSHLGDWLINAFPLASASDARPLNVTTVPLQNQPLDRVIQQIQRHRKVFSERLHPLLCALTSAEEVAYVEQREEAASTASGKFRSMLMDIFDRNYPEKTFWRVDRERVSRYKHDVYERTQQIQTSIEKILSGD